MTGMDGSHLSEFLLDKDYEVHGIIRRSSSFNTQRIDHIFNKLQLHYGDLTDGNSIANLIHTIKPDEIYHLGAMSHVQVSFETPEYTTDVGALGTIRILETLRTMDNPPKLYNAASSELFGSSPPPQNEQTPFRPRSPYAIAKLASYWNVVNYREGYNLFTSNGILFNHEGQRRGETFVTRKITKAIANILKGTQDKLILGNIDAKRDWGYSPDYVEAMWLILQYDKPTDFVIATGEMHSIKEFLEVAFNYVNLDWTKYVLFNHPKYMRPTEVDALCGDSTKARMLLGWEPKTSFKELVKLMVKADITNTL